VKPTQLPSARVTTICIDNTRVLCARWPLISLPPRQLKRRHPLQHQLLQWNRHRSTRFICRWLKEMPL